MNEGTSFLRAFIQTGKEHLNSVNTKHAEADSTPDRLTRSLQQCGHGTVQTGPCLSGWHVLHRPLPSWPRPPAAVRQTQSSVTPNLSRDPVLLAKTALRHSPPPRPAPRAHQSHSLPAQGPAPFPAPGSSWISSTPSGRHPPPVPGRAAEEAPRTPKLRRPSARSQRCPPFPPAALLTAAATAPARGALGHRVPTERHGATARGIETTIPRRQSGGDRNKKRKCAPDPLPRRLALHPGSCSCPRFPRWGPF